MANSNLKYLIAGTGGVGGSIAAFLSLSGKDVTCIARGEHLAAIRGNGLQLHSDLKGEHCLKVAAFTAEEFQGKADVIFVCVKGYSVDSITELIKRASHERTVVIPILNVYGTGPRIQRLVPGVTVLDGCIYIVGFVSGRGEITQMGKIFRLVYGAHRSTIVSRETLEAVQRDLQESGIKADISDDIDRDTFVKWSFISAMAVTGAYYDVPMGEVQKPGKAVSYTHLHTKDLIILVFISFYDDFNFGCKRMDAVLQTCVTSVTVSYTHLDVYQRQVSKTCWNLPTS